MYTKTSTWRVNVLLFVFFTRTLLNSVWVRTTGFKGVLLYPFRALGFLTKASFFLMIFGWRAKIVLLAYTWFRHVDDVMDGDILPPFGVNLNEYVEDKKEVLSHLLEGRKKLPCSAEDLVLVSLLEEAEKHRVYIAPEVEDLWYVVHNDFSRRRKFNLTPIREGLGYFEEMQDRAFLGACAKIFGLDLKGFSFSFGFFSRAERIRDVVEDIKKGIVNISKEEICEYRIDLENLLSVKSWKELISVPGFGEWYIDEVQCLKEEAEVNEKALKAFALGIFGPFWSRWIGPKLISWKQIRTRCAQIRTGFFS